MSGEMGSCVKMSCETCAHWNMSPPPWQPFALNISTEYSCSTGFCWKRGICRWKERKAKEARQ